MSEVSYERSGRSSADLKDLLAVPSLEEAITPAAVQATKLEQRVEEQEREAVAAASVAPGTQRRRKPKVSTGVTQSLIVFESRPELLSGPPISA